LTAVNGCKKIRFDLVSSKTARLAFSLETSRQGTSNNSNSERITHAQATDRILDFHKSGDKAVRLGTIQTEEDWGFNPDSAVPADGMSEEQTFRSEVNGPLPLSGYRSSVVKDKI
jgi:hypothetical protein